CGQPVSLGWCPLERREGCLGRVFLPAVGSWSAVPEQQPAHGAPGPGGQLTPGSALRRKELEGGGSPPPSLFLGGEEGGGGFKGCFEARFGLQGNLKSGEAPAGQTRGRRAPVHPSQAVDGNRRKSLD